MITKQLNLLEVSAEVSIVFIYIELFDITKGVSQAMK